jgi:hypothetical protein
MSLGLFYRIVAPWLEPCEGNDSILIGVTGPNPTLEQLVEAAKQTFESLVVNSDYPQYPSAATTAGRNLAMETALPQALVEERMALKDEITQGQSVFSMRQNGIIKRFSGETGEEVYYDGQGSPRTKTPNDWFATVDLATLRAVRDQITLERGFKQQSVAELRAQIKPQRQNPALPSSKPVESSDGYQLINPSTLQEFTRPELLAFVSVRGNATRILVHPDSRTINQRAVARMKEILGAR